MTNVQAIDLLKGLEQSLDDYCGLNEEGKTVFRMAITALEVVGSSEQLSSTQPDIIRCKDCKHYNAGFECLIEGYGIEREKDWYCADAERRNNE